MKIPTTKKIAQLIGIENEAKREIEREETTIEEYKEKLGIE
jgi:ABC-type Fe3+-citrate transport system substrate-binding protein